MYYLAFVRIQPENKSFLLENDIDICFNFVNKTYIIMFFEEITKESKSVILWPPRGWFQQNFIPEV